MREIDPGTRPPMSDPRDERPDGDDEHEKDLEQVQRPMDDPQTRPALDPESDD